MGRYAPRLRGQDALYGNHRSTVFGLNDEAEGASAKDLNRTLELEFRCLHLPRGVSLMPHNRDDEVGKHRKQQRNRPESSGPERGEGYAHAS
eukprot:CAMPEP_0180767344 /NCGR_PEP_ID=MMETSP1038_2-20121128/39969_1 /TAXON_ID=632150 /ORGANISM="Azadinium spinosum, Strain 3D9" /LENGTH=91 /DNA_ID=CAMNT_0022801897 /DNA_START=621 /DNA_END=896 /DNA_ORIENTATION=+